MNRTLDLLRIGAVLRVFQVADASGGGGDTPPGDTPPAGGDIPPDDTAPPADAAPRWWEGKGISDTQRTQLTALGLTVDDPVEAIARLTDMEAAAKKRLGASPDSLMAKPGKDQAVTDWMKANGEMFGIPEAAEGYEIQRPESWPKDAAWDDALEAQARTMGHQMGLSQAQMQGMIDLYAGQVSNLLGGSEQAQQAAQQELRTELTRDWGDQYNAKVALAQQAASALSEAAGLDATALANIAGTLQGATGDANTLRLFATIGEMMGDDSLPRLEGVSGGFGTTPAEARAEVAKMIQPDSDYMKAAADKRAGKPGASQRYNELHKRRLELEKLGATR